MKPHPFHTFLSPISIINQPFLWALFAILNYVCFYFSFGLAFYLPSLIDHGDGLIALRVLNPLAIDSGFYTCMVASEYGCCSTSCEVTIKEAKEVVRETIPTFIDEPVPVVAMHGSVVSFCGRVSPISSKVKWFVCGREITESSRGTIVSNRRKNPKQNRRRKLSIFIIHHQICYSIESHIHP